MARPNFRDFRSSESRPLQAFRKSAYLEERDGGAHGGAPQFTPNPAFTGN
jgi:hypothetical protein